MARTQPDDQWHESNRRNDIGGWQELRSDILGLLHETVSHENTARGNQDREADRRHGRAYAHDPRDTMDGRHRQALRSVTETMERFNTRRNPEVDSAIAQIRQRHVDVPARRPERISQFQDTVNGMSARLERLGSELRHAHDSPAGLKEIADQVAQLTDVVELLAGAVGESGQVKRLEAQIAHLAKLVGDGRQPADNGVTERLNRIAQAIDHMSDMQQQYADKPLGHLHELNTTHKSGLKSIEDGVRNIYDRIDALEQNLALNPADVDRLSREMATISAEMANVSEAMKSGGGTSEALLDRIDALNARVGQMDGGAGGTGGDVGGLRADISALREAVRETVEPRFSALKSQLDDLDQRIGTQDNSDITPSQLEGQIRQLIARMDQTGEQLADIKQMYQTQAGQPSAMPPAADVEALAEAIARKTGGPAAGGGPAELSPANIDELELRLSKLFGAVGNSVEAGAFSEMHDSLRRVDERLSRLESTLMQDGGRYPAGDDDALRAEWEEPEPMRAAAPEPMAATQPETVRAPRAYSRLDDSMDVNPAEERPLVDPGFGSDFTGAADYGTAEAFATPQRSHEGPDTSGDIGGAAEDLRAPEAGPAAVRFDPEMAERPAKPKSSLFADEEPAFGEPKVQQQTRDEPAPRQPVSQSSRNTFIEAARRAAQKQEEPAASNAQSIIARAMSRFQSGGDAAGTRKAEPAPADEKPSRADRKAAAKAEKAARARMQAEARAETRQPDIAPETGKESFISRHRRLLLLSAALVTICLLTFNLIERRLGADSNAAANSVSAPAETAPANAAPTEAPETNEDQALLDPQPTGSIDPFVRMAPERQPVMTQNLPTMLTHAAENMGSLDRGISTGSIPDTSATSEEALPDPVQEPVPGPITVELPPEIVGPLALREAAANGDARAQFEVAAIYSEGQALAKDSSEAAKWYERAAAQGFAPAEYRLANLYEHGEGVQRDLMQAKLWYQRAAEAGNRMAMHNLAALYASGEMGKQEFSLAAEWFERAASTGLTDSQFNLGMLYARGLGVPQNMPASYKWFSLAAMRGDDGAAKARDDIARSLDADTVARLKQEIAEWQPAEIDIQANFAPIGTWAETFNPGQTISDRNVVEKVQGALNRLGFDVGTPDGLMGPRTRDAIRSFERETGMSESGAINPRLLAVLGSQPV